MPWTRILHKLPSDDTNTAHCIVHYAEIYFQHDTNFYFFFFFNFFFFWGGLQGRGVI